MRKLSDTGLSANERYALSSNKHGNQLQSSKIIRLFADYNKCIKVRNSMIKIECQIDDNPDRSWFTIWDDKIKSRYNGIHIRVRMVLSHPSVIYLFDPDTDTYLGFLNKDYEPAGDRANQTEQDVAYMMAHSSKKTRQHNSRVELKDKILEDISATDNEKLIHESLQAPLLLSGPRVEPMDSTEEEPEPPNAESQQFKPTTESSEPSEETGDYASRFETVEVDSVLDEELEPA